MSAQTVWIAVLATGAGCYLLKLLGMSVPAGLLERPLVRRASALLPLALLAGLTAVQTFAQGMELRLDARAAGLAAAVAAVLLRAPFLVVVGVAVAVTAAVRAVAG